MNTDQYIEAQRQISLIAALYVLQFSNLLAKPKMTVAEWISSLQFMYPKIEEYRQEAANLAREFYDAERSRALPMLARNDQFLETYSPERFIHDMAA